MLRKVLARGGYASALFVLPRSVLSHQGGLDLDRAVQEEAAGHAAANRAMLCGALAQGWLRRVPFDPGAAALSLARARQAWPDLDPLLHQTLAATLRKLGVACLQVGQDAESATAFALAEGIYRRLLPSDPQRFALKRGESLHGLGMATSNLLKAEEAEKAYREAITIWREHRAESTLADLNLAFTLSNLANLLREQRRANEAEPCYREANEILRLGFSSTVAARQHTQALISGIAARYRTPDRFLIKNLINMGAILMFQGALVEAEEALAEAETILATFPATDPPRASWLAAIDTNRGAQHLEEGRYQDAVTMLNRALEHHELHAHLSNTNAAPIATLINLGVALRYLDDLAAAETVLSRVVTILQAELVARPFPTIADYSTALAGLAEVLRRQGRRDEATTLLQQALAFPLPEQLRWGFWRLHAALARLLPTAIARYDHLHAALVALEIEQRRPRHNADRRSFQREYQAIHAEMIDCCLQLGRPDEAWWWSERGRSRSLLDLLRNPRPRLETAEARQRYGAWLAAERQVAQLADRLASIQQRPSELAGDGDEIVLREELPPQPALAAYLAAEQEADRRYRQVMGAGGAQRLRATVPRPSHLIALLRHLACRTPRRADTAARPLLIEYALLDERRCLAFLVPLWDRESDVAAVIPVELPLEAGQLAGLLQSLERAQAATAAAAAHGWITSADLRDWDALPERLGAAFARPLAKALRRLQPSELILVPQGPLQLFPLHAAAYQPGILLIADYPIITLPNAALARTLAQRRKRTNWPRHRLVLGPAGNDLPAAEQEAMQLAFDWGLSDADAEQPPFARERMTLAVLAAQAGKASIIHLATHATFNQRNYLRSAIIFGGEERLQVAQLLGHPEDDAAAADGQAAMIDLHGVRLCFLNSCLGARVAPDAGNDLPGLVWALIAAGAEAVLASLWAADDLAAARFADLLYNEWSREGQTLAVAYRCAVNQLRSQGEFASPYFWAPFTLVGNAFSTMPPLPG